MKHCIVAFIISISICAGCAHGPGVRGESSATPTKSSPQDSETAEKMGQEDEKAGVVLAADPLYPINTVMFEFNDKLYFWFLKPVATGYKFVMPYPARLGVRNFFHNLATPIRLVNSLFQGKVEGAGREIGRFAINTTVGVLGFWDPARKYADLEPCEEDLGQTLGFYGIGHGFYIVWPLMGPSTLRDTFGRAGDSLLNPISYVEPWWAGAGASGIKMVNNTSLRLGDYEEIKEISFDPYIAIQDGYLQHRKSQVNE